MWKKLAVLALALLPVASAPYHQAHAAPTALFGWSVKVTVTPDPMHYNMMATVTAHTKSGASCTAAVVYDNGRIPTSFHGVAEVATTGVDTWTWHEETKSTGSMATVTCTKGSKTHTGSAHFVVR
jgi:hypothetical protein